MVSISPELAWEMPKAAGIACEITPKRTEDGEEEAAMPAARKLCRLVIGRRGVFQII